MKRIPLTELNAEIHTVNWGEWSSEGLWLDCPMCLDAEYPHHQLIPFIRDQRQHGDRDGRLLWGHSSGDNVGDITLSPSFLARGRCRLHVFIRDGFVEVLGDSSPSGPK